MREYIRLNPLESGRVVKLVVGMGSLSVLLYSLNPLESGRVVKSTDYTVEINPNDVVLIPLNRVVLLN